MASEEPDRGKTQNYGGKEDGDKRQPRADADGEDFDRGSTRVVRARCPYCERGPLPTRPGPQLCSNCSTWFTVEATQ